MTCSAATPTCALTDEMNTSRSTLPRAWAAELADGLTVDAAVERAWERARAMRDAGEMHHMADAVQQPGPIGRLRQIGHRHPLHPGDRRDRRRIARSGPDLPAFLGKRLCQILADEAGGAGDQHAPGHD